MPNPCILHVPAMPFLADLEPASSENLRVREKFVAIVTRAIIRKAHR